MKFIKNGNLAKLVAFFVIAAIMICTVSFAANGWQSFLEPEPDSDNNVTIKPGNENIDENKDGETNNKNDDIPTIVPTPSYIHYLTGLETTSDISMQKPLCMVIGAKDPLYGISSSFLTIELPIEDGNTRFLVFTNDAQSLGKIGSIAPTRGYINNLASYFGGIILSYGNDDTFRYEFDNPSTNLDFTANVGYCYTEYNSFVYTNGDLVSAFLNNTKVNTLLQDSAHAPYLFNASENTIAGTESATLISITYADSNITGLSYSTSDEKYLLSKNNSGKNDLLNDKSIAYDNVFILSVDSTTHETTDTTQLILNTNTNGNGKYISKGTAQNITWGKDSAGNLVFYNEEGEKLLINPGTSYIAYVKSSLPKSVKIS